MELLERIDNRVKNTLSEKRYFHSVCTMNRMEILAKIYNIDVEKAKLVGLIHDIAKEMLPEDAFEYMEKNELIIDDIEKKCPSLLHAKIGANIAKTEYGFTEEMCKAIRVHTTGSADMSLMDKMLFIADGTGDDRKWEDVPYVRELYEKNLDVAVLYMLDLNIKDIIDEKKLIHPDSVLARNALIK